MYQSCMVWKLKSILFCLCVWDIFGLYCGLFLEVNFVFWCLKFGIWNLKNIQLCIDGYVYVIVQGVFIVEGKGGDVCDIFLLECVQYVYGFLYEIYYDLIILINIMKEVKVELFVDFFVDLCIVFSFVLEGLSNNWVVGFFYVRNFSVGLIFLKRIYQGLEEVLVVKCVKLESGVRFFQKLLSDDVRNFVGFFRDIVDCFKQYFIFGGNGDQYNDDQNMDVGIGDGGYVVVDKKVNLFVEFMEVNFN